jgi:CHAT domain-containing protein
MQAQTLNTAEIQRELDGNTLLLEYSLGERRSFLWLVSPEQVSMYALPGRTEVERAVHRFREQVVRPRRPWRTQAAALTRMLLGPVAGRLGRKRLVISGDGALHYVPFAALPDPQRPGQPLSATPELVRLPSASVLAALRREVSQDTPLRASAVVFADPVYHRDDARVEASEPLPGRMDADTAIARAASDLQLDAESRLPRLIFTREEAKSIASFARPGAAELNLDFEARRDAVLALDSSRARVLHFASHALINNVHPELSGIVLSLVDRKGNGLDGFLRLHEIFNLHLSAALVVVSACESGLGKEVRGEGLVGFTRGFFYAGAPRVLVSLWRVNDEATAAMMKHFYRAMFSMGRSPAAALRSAQTAMRGDPRWNSPYYWAGFVLQGEWR